MRRVFALLFNTLLPILLVLGAVSVTRQLIAGKDPPPRVVEERRATLVTAATAVRVRERPRIRAQGSVGPARQTTLQSEVVGRIVELSPRLEPGGLVSEGETLVRIDARDYRIAVAEARTNLDSARTNVDVERGRRRVAEREWNLFRDELGADGDATLALREPQSRSADLAVEAAEVQLERARVTLGRTTISAPFDAIVLSESVERGQLLTQQNTVATLVATDAFWIEVAVPLDELPRLRIPGLHDGPGHDVEVVQQWGETRSVRQGRVLRLLPDVDASARMARVLVAVDDPLLRLPSTREAQPEALPLLLGSLVDCEFVGVEPVDLVPVPRLALRGGHAVWVMTPDDRLETRPVTIAWTTPDTALLSSGLQPGERFVTSSIVAPVDGMTLRVASGQDPLPERGSEPGAEVAP